MKHGSQMRKYAHAVLGGTFDHLHAGHMGFLRFGLERSTKLIIGLSDGALLENKPYRYAMQSYADRKQALIKFLKEEDKLHDVAITPLFDHCGIAGASAEVDVVFVTPLTLPGVSRVNILREKNHLKPLMCECSEIILDQQGKHLSSTRIRAGEVARDGFAYVSLFSDDITLHDENKRNTLREVWGEQLRGMIQEKNAPIILIGDGTTRTFIQHHWPFSVAYIDGKIERKNIALPPYIKTDLENPAGTISHRIVGHMLEHVSSPATYSRQVFLIQGEEDLCVLPAVLCLPLGTHVVYGNPKVEEMFDIVVSEEIKEKLRAFLTHSLRVTKY